MRGFRGGVGIGAILSGILSFRSAASLLPDFFAQQAMAQPTPFRKHRAARTVKRRPARVHRGWRPGYYAVAGPDSREAERRRRQGAHYSQIFSHPHKSGTVMPRHIFGKD